MTPTLYRIRNARIGPYDKFKDYTSFEKIPADIQPKVAMLDAISNEHGDAAIPHVGRKYPSRTVRDASVYVLEEPL